MLEFFTFTMNKYVVIGFKSITQLKGCVPLDLRSEMTVMPLDRVLGNDRPIRALGYDLHGNLFSLHLGIDE